MITLCRLNGGVVVSTGHTPDKANTIKALDKGTLVHYITSDVQGEIVPRASKIILDDSGNPIATYRTFDEIRAERNEELEASDWRATIDYPGPYQKAWLEHRAKLRDIPQDYKSVASMVWPIKPGG